MQVINLSENNSVLSNYIREIRDEEIQKDSLRFRRNIERIGELMAFELSKTFKYKEIEVKTPLGISSVNIIDENLVIASVLRAGLPLHIGFLNVFDHAENAFVSAYRKYKDENNFDIHVEYISAPDIAGKTLILTDPMLATGGSMEMSYKAILRKGIPKNLHIVSIISSKHAVEYLQKIMPKTSTLWLAAVDNDLNSHAYIVPGLGDAGDLSFGEKTD